MMLCERKKLIVLLLILGTVILTIKSKPVTLADNTYDLIYDNIGFWLSGILINIIEGSFILICFGILAFVILGMFPNTRK